MSSSEHEHVHERFPERALARYAEIVLREIYQREGRSRFVPVSALEVDLGLERELILHLCRTTLVGEVLVAERLTEELEETLELRTPLERQWVRDFYSQPHVRIRPPAVRLTEEELLEVRAQDGKRGGGAGKRRKA